MATQLDRPAEEYVDSLDDRPDGPAAAVVMAAGIGSATLGVLTTFAVISSGVNDFLGKWAFDQGVGPLAGKTTIASIVFFVAWFILHRMWATRDMDFAPKFRVALILIGVGILGTFPTFFELFH